MIAVTGAIGFIGSRVSLKLADRFPVADLVAVDHPPVSQKAGNMAELSGIRFENHNDFLKKLGLGTLKPDVIIHLGACSSTTENNWNYLVENNLEYSKRLWEWCADTGGRLIYASSAATYGDGSEGFNDETDIQRLNPLNLYGKSKHVFDLWVEERARMKNVGPKQCVGLKFFNVFGPGESHKGRMASMVFHAFNQIKATGEIKLFESHRPDFEHGGQLRDFIYVDQVVSVILQYLEKPQVSGLFNLGTGKARSFRELGEAVFTAMNRPSRIAYIPMPLDIAEKYQYFTEASMRKTELTNVHVPKLSLEEAVLDYVRQLGES